MLERRHAMYVGWVCGLARKQGTPLTPVVDEEGNYTDQLTLGLVVPHVTVTVIVPPPPDDWVID